MDNNELDAINFFYLLFSTTVKSVAVLLLTFGKLGVHYSLWQPLGDLGDISLWMLSGRISHDNLFRLWERVKLVWYVSLSLSPPLSLSLPPPPSLSLSPHLSLSPSSPLSLPLISSPLHISIQILNTVINNQLLSIFRLASKPLATCTPHFLMTHWRSFSMVVFILTLRADSLLKIVSTT